MPRREFLHGLCKLAGQPHADAHVRLDMHGLQLEDSLRTMRFRIDASD